VASLALTPLIVVLMAMRLAVENAFSTATRVVQGLLSAVDAMPFFGQVAQSRIHRLGTSIVEYGKSRYSRSIQSEDIRLLFF
jgi:hypothetical protein